MFPTKNKTINRWAAVLSFLFLGIFVTIWGRFFYLAEVKNVSGHNLIKLGKNEWTTVKLVNAQRGEILGRNGAILAHDVPAYTIYAVLSSNAPSYVKNKQKTAQALAPILHTNVMQLLNYMNSKNFQVQFGTVGTNISFTQMQQIQKLNLPGIGFIKGSMREYPNGVFASHVIGFTVNDQKTQKQVGAYGIEKSLNSYLSETNGTIKFYSDSQGNVMPVGNQQIKTPKNGDNVTLTLDQNIQSVLDNTMTKVNQEYKPQHMIAIVMDPKTGAILGMSTRPGFNPNLRNISDYLNSAISYSYEPGSVMKIFTLAAAINQGVWNGSATYPSGTYTVDGVPIHDWQQGWGTITFKQGLQRSSNVAFSRIVDKILGPANFYKYIQGFGLTKKTGIDLPGEANSIVNFKNRVDQVMAGFGQGSAFTAIQLVQAASAIANKGAMMKPYVIQKIVDPNTNKVIKETKPTVVGHPITAATASKVRDLLRGVVDPNVKDGTGHGYNIPGYQVIGKTGTAQIAVNGHYLTGINNYIFSFMGMAPEKNPKLIVYVALDRPQLKQSEGYSESAPISKIFIPVMKTGLQSMGVTPLKGNGSSSSNDPTAIVNINQYVGQSLTSAETALEQQGLKVVALGSGAVQQQSLSAGMTVFKGSQIILLGGGTPQMPDLTHWTLNQVLSLCQILDLKPAIKGDGFVVSQDIKAGASLQAGDTLSVTLQSPSQAAANQQTGTSSTTSTASSSKTN